MRVKSIILFDLSDIIKDVNREVLKYNIEYGLSSKRDLTNLFLSAVFIRMVECYLKDKTKFTTFFISKQHREEMMNTDKSCLINYKKFLKLVDKTFDFPLIESNLEYKFFVELLKGDAPEYDEIIQNHRSFAEIMPKMYEIVSKLKFSKLCQTLLGDNKNLFQLLQTL